MSRIERTEAIVLRVAPYSRTSHVVTWLTPEPGRLVNSNLGYYIRQGQHSQTAEDWQVFLDFADKHLKAP